MGAKQLREALLFEYERITDIIMEFGYGVVLKLVADLGFKDSSGHKRRSYEEFRYRNTSKYNNTDYLITASRKAEYYLKIEYPVRDTDGNNRKGSVVIRPYSMLGLYDIVKEFDRVAFDPYKTMENGDIYLIEKKAKMVRSVPTSNSIIEISHGMYKDKDGKLDYGVDIGLNEEFYFTVRTTTMWKQFVYFITKCDLYLWGSSLLNPYTTALVGNSLSEFGQYNSTKRYEITYEPDLDDKANDDSMIKVSNSKPVTRNDKIKSFFDRDD
jgi:hypothetical protein